jgi:hypothetical protein
MGAGGGGRGSQRARAARARRRLCGAAHLELRVAVLGQLVQRRVFRRQPGKHAHARRVAQVRVVKGPVRVEHEKGHVGPEPVELQHLRHLDHGAAVDEQHGADARAALARRCRRRLDLGDDARVARHGHQPHGHGVGLEQRRQQPRGAQRVAVGRRQQQHAAPARAARAQRVVRFAEVFLQQPHGEAPRARAPGAVGAAAAGVAAATKEDKGTSCWRRSQCEHESGQGGTQTRAAGARARGGRGAGCAHTCARKARRFSKSLQI